MGLQALYIREDNLVKLKKEKNMSELINNLLSEYYGDKRSEEQIISDVKTKIDLDEVKRKRLEEFKISFFNTNPNATPEDLDKFLDNSSTEFKARMGIKQKDLNT